MGEGVAWQRVADGEEEEGIKAVVHAEFGEGLGRGVAVVGRDRGDRGEVGEMEGR